MNKSLGLIGASAVVGVSLMAFADTASAENQPTTASLCRVIVDTKPSDGVITVGGKGFGKINNGNVLMRTPVGDTDETRYSSWVRWTVDNEDFKLKHLVDLSYMTLVKSDGLRGSAAPAVRLVLTNGVTLVYEPYWNGSISKGDDAEWQKWVVTSPEAKLWDSPGPSEPGSDTYAGFVEKMGDVKVKEINVGMGTWNEGAEARTRGLKFTYKGACQTASPTPTSTGTSVPTTTPTMTTSPSPTVSVSPTATKTSSAPVPTTTQSSSAGLPVTGDNTGKFIGAGIAAVIIGAIGIVIARKRREAEFVAE